MNKSEFREQIYGPYVDAWKIISQIREADQSRETDATWIKFRDSMDEFSKNYQGNEFASKLVRLMLDAGDIIAKING